MVRHVITTTIGKTVRMAMRLRGGGSALPGLVIEKIDPGFIARTLSSVPRGVVIVSGTNGKTTTTKIVVELLEAAGLKVFTNRTGSNFSRGVAAALIGEVTALGTLDADIAVLELDEAWAVKFVQLVKPRYSLLLNVMRDQLDRFGEIDTTARLLENIANATTDTVVLNRDDPRVCAIRTTGLTAKPVFFGTTTELLTLMPTDDALKSGGAAANETIAADVLLTNIAKQTATYQIDGRDFHIEMQLNGVYNLLNAAAALSLVRQITPDTPIDTLTSALATVRPAFGRGETIVLDGTPIELILVKNPSGFRLALLSFSHQAPTMIAINDNYADGRDVSWLWDVDFTPLHTVAMVAGTRAYDMALRLGYDDISPTAVEPDLTAALHQFLAGEPGTPKHIFCTYTAMITLRKLLATKTAVENIS